MRMTSRNGFTGFTTVDIATGAEIKGVMWVDDTTLEYATVIIPYVIVDDEVAVDIHKLAAVRVDWVNHRIEVAHQSAQSAPWPFPTSQGKQCDACCQPETCKRIDFCAAHRCRFGEDDAP